MEEYIELSTKQGKLQGLVKKSEERSNKTYYSFQGIPYAKPPVGNLRFKVAQPFEPWEDIRDATYEGDDVLQKHLFFKVTTGSEDCLYLNVYTTQPGKKDAKLAVMVWIHGGGFSRGSGSTELYGPDYLIEEDIVLVTINYRCGALGFLSLENETLPGNLGLKDQCLALQWVQEHIESFGGDPGNVTIFGESAGAASVHYHLLSPLSRGLFHKAILQSGSSLNQWAFQPNPRQKALLFAKELGCTSQDPDEILEFLMSAPAHDILNTQEKDTLRSKKEFIQMFSLVFLPCVDIASDAPFLPDTPRKLMERGDFAKVPVILGLTDKEGLLALILQEVKCEKVNADPSVMVPMDLAFNAGIEAEQRLGKEILQFYTNKDVASWDTVHGYVDFVTDVGFSIGLDISRQCFLRHLTAPVYTYQFTYTSPRAFSSFLIPVAYPDKSAEYVGSGACHGDELVFLFKTNIVQMPIPPPSQEDHSFTNKFVKAWTAFAKTGNPNCKEIGVTWNRDSIENALYLDLGKVWKPINHNFFPKRIDFWKKIYEEYSFLY